MIIYQDECLTVWQSGLQQTNSGVAETPDLVLLTDPTWLPAEIVQLQLFIRNRLNGRPLYVLFTHSDFDHILGYGAFPEAKFIASAALRDHPNKEEAIEQIRDWDRKNYVQRPHEIAYPRIDIAISGDGQRFSLLKSVLSFQLAPGHNPDGIFTLVENTGILFTGDYLSDFELPFLYFGYASYLESLRKAETLINEGKVRMLVPGHGQPTGNVAEMRRRLAMGRSYLSRLEGAIRSGDEGLLRAMQDEFAFPSDFTRGCHETNIRLVRRECEENLRWENRI